MRHLRTSGAALDDPDRLLEDYSAACAQLDEDVAVRLLPSGTFRGRAVGIDESCSLVLESRTGLRERVPVGSLASLEIYSSPDA